LTVDPKGMTCRVAGGLSDAALTLEEKRFAVEGIDLSIVVPDVFRRQSAPAQQLRFRTMRFGELVVDGGGVDFKIESDGSLFVEKGSFNWCGGKVDTHALRIGPQQDDYHLVLYCDRLALSEILEQFGAAQAEGGGTLNGKLPVRLENGQLRFDDGFLFSTPGEGGTIRLHGTEILTAGIPADTVQYTQLELARSALKDYTYQWVKLRLNTEGETLLMRMQMDGKPAGPLPFLYDPQRGGFVKAGPESQGSVFQGISLDVNFRLPLDRMLAHGETLKRVLELMPKQGEP